MKLWRLLLVVIVSLLLIVPTFVSAIDSDPEKDLNTTDNFEESQSKDSNIDFPNIILTIFTLAIIPVITYVLQREEE